MTDDVRRDRPTVLAHSIRVPERGTRTGVIALMGIGAAVVFLLGYAVLVFITQWLRSWIAGDGAGQPSRPCVSGFFVGTLLVVWWVAFVDYRARVSHARRTQTRHDRLERLAARADAAIRLPHRVVELAYRDYARQPIKTPWTLTRRLRDLLVRAPRGIAVVVARGRNDLLPRPVSTDAAFEPCEVDKPTPQLLALLSRTWPETESPDGNEQRDRVPAGCAASSGVRTGARLTNTILIVLGWGIIALMFFQGVMYNNWACMLMVALILAPVLAILMSPLFGGRTWWVVPRGLVCRDHRLWRKDVRVRLITRATASLIVEKEDRVIILEGDELQRITWPRHSTEQKRFATAAVIAAWVSNAPAPTKEQVLAFVGPEARLVE
jgi:hypothetical protein